MAQNLQSSYASFRKRRSGAFLRITSYSDFTTHRSRVLLTDDKQRDTQRRDVTFLHCGSSLAMESVH